MNPFYSPGFLWLETGSNLLIEPSFLNAILSEIADNANKIMLLIGE